MIARCIVNVRHEVYLPSVDAPPGASKGWEAFDVSELRRERINYRETSVDARNTSIELKTSETAKRYLRWCFNVIPRQPLSAHELMVWAKEPSLAGRAVVVNRMSALVHKMCTLCLSRMTVGEGAP